MDPVLARLLAVVGVVVLATAAGKLWQARDGRVTTSDEARDRPRLSHDRLDALGLAGSSRAAVLFGSPTCTPCDSVKVLLRELEADDPGFRWTYVDAAEHLDLADEHRVRRVPTLLVVDGQGAVTARTSGVPDRDALRAAVSPTVAA